MVCGIPKCTHTHSKKILEVASAVILFLQVAKITILERRSTNTKTQSFTHLVDGRPDMQFIDMDSQNLSGVGIGVYRPCSLVAGLEIV
jgi:hypothetical protein